MYGFRKLPQNAHFQRHQIKTLNIRKKITLNCMEFWNAGLEKNYANMIFFVVKALFLFVESKKYSVCKWGQY